MIWNTFLPIVLSYFCVYSWCHQQSSSSRGTRHNRWMSASLLRWSGTGHQPVMNRWMKIQVWWWPIYNVHAFFLRPGWWLSSQKLLSMVFVFKIAENSLQRHHNQHLHLPPRHHYRLILPNQLLAHLRAKISSSHLLQQYTYSVRNRLPCLSDGTYDNGYDLLHGSNKIILHHLLLLTWTVASQESRTWIQSLLRNRERESMWCQYGDREESSLYLDDASENLDMDIYYR